VGVLDALFVVSIPVVALIMATSAVWFIENDPTLPWFTSLNTALDLWYVSHGVSLEVAKQTLVGIPTPAFTFSLPPLGLMLIVVLFGRRTAKKLTGSIEYWPGWLGAGAVYGAASVLLLPLASNENVAPNANQAVIYPTALYLISMVAFSLFGSQPKTAVALAPAFEREALGLWWQARKDRANWFVASITAPAFKAGTAVVVGLMAVSALMVAVSLTVNWISVTRLYEGLQVSIIGGFALTIGQLAILPNIVAYGASWLTGVGFAIGTGSNVSPLGTQLGPIPALPILGGLPIGTVIPALAVIAVPMVLALLATVMVKGHTKQIRFNFATPLAAALSLGVGIGVVAAVEGAVLAFLASGSLGPGRLETFGINPWMLAGVLFIEVAPVAVLAAFYAARPEKAAPIPEYLKR
jgi:hypothetical protein